MKLYQNILKLYLKLLKFKVYPLERLDHIPKKILVISHTALGDALFATPAIKSLKLSFPDCKIIGVLNKSYIPLFKNFPYIDKIYPFKKGVFNIISLGNKLKNENAEIALIFHGNFPEDILLCALSKVKFVLKSRLGKEYLNYLSFKNFKDDIHAIEVRLSLVKALGAKVITKEMEIGPLINKEIEEKVNKMLSNKREKSSLIGFQLGASYISKSWPVENFVKLAELLNKKGSFYFILIGSKKEEFLGKKFESLYSYNNYLNCVGKLTLEEVPYLIKKLDLLVTPDTGILHLAVALKVPTVSLFALTNADYLRPIQDEEIHRVIFNPEGLRFQHIKKRKRPQDPMKAISPDKVLKEVLNLIG